MESIKHFSNTVPLKFVFNINSFGKPKIEKKHLWQSTFHSDLIVIKYKKKYLVQCQFYLCKSLEDSFMIYD